MDSSTLEKISTSQCQSVNEIFYTATSIHEAVQLCVDDSHQWFGQLRQKFKTAQSVACKKGCAWCCRQRVSLSPAEAFHIGWFIEENLYNGTDWNQVKNDTALRWQVEDQLDSPARFETGIPCPFLDVDNKLCLIHAVRPFSCRWYESMDDVECKKSALENNSNFNIPYDPRIQIIAQAVERGMLLGFEDQGLSGGLLVMTGAMTILWNEEGCFENWIAGNKPFLNSQVE